MSAIISGLIGATAAAALAIISERRQRSARIGADGWRVLRPSGMMHLGFVLSVLFAVLVAVFLWTGGSARSDAATQNLSALGIGVFFGLGAGYMWWLNYGRLIAWKENDLRVRSVFGREVVRQISDVEDVIKREGIGDFKVRFRDNSTLIFSAYSHGAKELAQRLDKDVIL